MPDKTDDILAEDSQLIVTRTILIVEDDIDVADSIKIRLESHGYRAVTAFDGLVALETAREVVPDLIILDISVPGLSGYHVCRLLKFDERYRRIPIIMLTGKADKDSRELGTKAGADKYMTKPFELPQLLEEIRKLTEGPAPGAGETT